ncbi:ROK family protein [Microbacterium sp. ASV49]|uniref:ROK family protein n=1 Tax=Microbacterium candidum TaxID=3041922 RepID=A0ABT7MU51_9MICO|nr:ROK family protein [Microbacterium sp. ASV49]MDL9977970.1 ROK family protein [Microbacterium sp. ASV49]
MRTSIDRGRGTDLAGIRRENLHRVLDVARTEPGSSQNDIAARTGLGIAAVSSLVNELLDAQILVQGDAAPTRTRGRPKRAVELADEWADIVGVSLERGQVEARAATLRGRELGRAVRSFPAPPSVEHAASAILAAIDEAIDGRVRPSGAPRVVIALPGGIRFDGIGATELEWVGESAAPLLAPLRDRGWPEPMVGNDGSLSAFAEARFGAAGSHANAVVLFLGRGLGGSAVIDDALIRGAATAPGFGHTVLDPHGVECNCGLRGCAERSVSLLRFAELLGEPEILETTTKAEYAAELDLRAAGGDERVTAVLADAATALEQLGDIVASLLNPEVVVLTGPGASLAPRILPAHVGNTRVPTAQGLLGDEVVIRGALAAAQELVLSDPFLTGDPAAEEWV